MQEIWKSIPGFENYLISNLGNVYNKKFNRVKKPTKGNGGYWSINLSKNGKSSFCLLHRIVAITFLPNPENKPQVNHINADKKDNTVNNLEWVTSKENNIHSVTKGNGTKGTQVWTAKLSEKDVIKIKNRLKQGETLVILAKEFNVCKQTIFKIKTNKIWKSIGEK